MHLNEFADTKASELRAAEVADLFDDLEAVWQGGLTDNGRPPTYRQPKQPADRRRRLVYKWQQIGSTDNRGGVAHRSVSCRARRVVKTLANRR